MRYLLTAEEMRRCDANTIEQIGIPGMVLMERAALAALECVMRVGGSRVLIMAGVGNNGGDGLALARLLSERDFAVTVWCVGDAEKASAQWRLQKHILEYYQVCCCDQLCCEKSEGVEYDVVVDALFGVGLSREITGTYAEAVARFNRLSGYKLALDVPSGICSDTGKVLGTAVSVDETVTFGFGKRGLFLFPGCAYAGKVRIVDVGITQLGFLGERPKMFCMDEGDALKLLPGRDAGGNKGTFGKVLLVAGSAGMAGAAVLGARAAYRTGAGMVKVITDQSNRVIIQEAVPEALFGTYEELESGIRWADVIVIGPGLSKSQTARACMQIVVDAAEKPLLIDADGLNILAEESSLQDRLRNRCGACILTPHMGELSRLTKLPVEQLKEQAWTYAAELAERLHCVVVAKDARTMVCAENQPVCLNIYGNSGMATAGSGDVLAGILGGLLAQAEDKDDAFSQACLGVYVHAAAGDAAAREKGEYGCMAQDIAEASAVVLKKITEVSQCAAE